MTCTFSSVMHCPSVCLHCPLRGTLLGSGDRLTCKSSPTPTSGFIVAGVDVLLSWSFSLSNVNCSCSTKLDQQSARLGTVQQQGRVKMACLLSAQTQIFRVQCIQIHLRKIMSLRRSVVIVIFVAKVHFVDYLQLGNLSPDIRCEGTVHHHRRKMISLSGTYKRLLTARKIESSMIPAFSSSQYKISNCSCRSDPMHFC